VARRAAIAFALVPAACLGGASTLPTGPPPPSAARAILFIGNSLTIANGLVPMLGELLELGSPERFALDVVAYPGFGLQDHWVYGLARSRIARGGWELVVLQQGPSATEGRPSLLDYTRRFDDENRRVGATTGLFMVWPDATRPFDFDGVSDSYATAARLVDGVLFPAGDAWRAAWARDPGIPLYGPDGFHPGLLGTYTAALVMYERLSGLPPTDLPPRIPAATGPIDIDPDLATLLQEAAHEANVAHAPAP